MKRIWNWIRSLWPVARLPDGWKVFRTSKPKPNHWRGSFDGEPSDFIHTYDWVGKAMARIQSHKDEAHLTRLKRNRWQSQSKDYVGRVTYDSKGRQSFTKKGEYYE